jgi:hypothetical protein
MTTDGSSRRPLERLLVACVREHPWEQPPGEAAALLRLVDQDRLLELSQQHRVSVALCLSLQHVPELRPDVRDRLKEWQRTAVLNQLLLEAELQRLGSVLRELPWLVVKGPVLARDYYRRPELRSYADLDVLVPPEHLAEAVQRFEKASYVLLDRNWTLLAQRAAGELHFLSPHGIMIDLHWDLFNDRATRNSYSMVTRSFFERSRPLRIGNVEVRTLDNLDTVVHTAVHAARSGGDRLIWMKDLEQLVLSRRFTWDDLAERCVEHHAQLAVSVMLHRMRATLDPPDVTDAALRKIGGPAVWRFVGRIVDRFAPVVRASSEGSLTRMYARATRANTRSTAAELMRRLAARARRRGWHHEDLTWDAAHRESVLYEAGGQEAKDAFFAAVRSEH